MAKGKPKILLISVEVNGIGSSGILAAAALSRRQDVDIHLIYDQTILDSALQRKKVEEISGLGIKTRKRADLPLAYLRIFFYCLKYRPDIVHDLCGSSYLKLSPLWPFFFIMSRLILTEPAPAKEWPSGFFRRLIRKAAYRCAEKFIVFGPTSYGFLAQSGVCQKKIFQSRLGHKGFYADAITTPPPRDPNLILLFGELRPGKGIDLLLPIAEAVHARRPEARFLIAGSSRDGHHYGKDQAAEVDQALAKMRNLSYFEVRDEFIPDENVAEYFYRAGMVILPYREANQSGVLLSAMYLECPVIAADVGDISSVIRHGENGILCAIDDTAAMADAIVSLLQNPAQGTQLAAQAKENAEAGFSWEDLVQEYPEKVYARG